MLRGTIRAAIEDIDYETLTLRSAVEWYKGVLRAAPDDGVLTEEETKYMNTAWLEIVRRLSEAQGIPQGMLGYVISEVTRYELSLSNAAAEEAVQAGIIVP